MQGSSGITVTLFATLQFSSRPTQSSGKSKTQGTRHQIQLSVLQSCTWFGLVLFLTAQGCSAITEPPCYALQYKERRRHHLGEAQVWHSFLVLPLPSPRQQRSGHFLQHYSPRFRTALEPQTSFRGQWKSNFCCTQRQQRRVPSNCWSQGRVPQVSPKQRRGGLPLNLQRILRSLLLRLALHCSERFREAFLLFIDSFSSSPAFYTNPTAQHALSGTGTLQPEPFLLWSTTGQYLNSDCNVLLVAELHKPQALHTSNTSGWTWRRAPLTAAERGEHNSSSLARHDENPLCIFKP